MTNNEILAELNRLAERDRLLIQKHRLAMQEVHSIEGQQAENRQTMRALRVQLKEKL